jgi:hypothetical protein
MMERMIEAVMRRRPKLVIYVRRRPVTREIPTKAQAELRVLFAHAVRIAKLLTVEKVAELVGGEVVQVGDKKYVKMPDGRILMKHMALVKHLLKGYSSPDRRYRMPLWLEELSKRLLTPVTPPELAEQIKAAKAVVARRPVS